MNTLFHPDTWTKNIIILYDPQISGWNTLLVAAKHGHLDVVDLLMQHGVEADTQDEV